MKIWAVSDTHGLEQYLKVQEADMFIHAGDATNYRELIPNNKEFMKFAEWLINLPINHKIIVPGNHDTWATKKYNVEWLRSKGIIVLIHEDTEIEGYKIFGSPYTPTFMDWNFMVSRDKISRYWESVKSADIIVTHGPPKGVLDLSYNRQGILEQGGDRALLKMIQKIEPIAHIFGHFHDEKECNNSGHRIIGNYKTKYYNASVVTNGRFEYGPTNNGQIIEL